MTLQKIGLGIYVRELLSRILMLFPAKAEIKDFKQTPSQNNKVRMQCIVDGVPSPEVTWYLQNTKLPYKQTFPDYDVTASDVLVIPQASLVNNSFLCNCTNPLDSVARYARSKFLKILVPLCLRIPLVKTTETLSLAPKQ